MNSAGKFAAAFGLGAAVAGLISLGWNPPPVEADLSTTTIAPVGEVVPWFEPGETPIGSTFILPRDLVVDGTRVVFDYELAGLSPTLHEREGAGHHGEVVAFPEHWVLTTTSGVDVEATTGVRDTSAWFELPSGDDGVATIRVVGWRVGSVFGTRVEVDAVVGATGSFRSGTVTVATVLEQSVSTIVQLDFEDTGDRWQFPVLRPIDRDWRWSGRSGGGMQLIWDGDDAPASFVIEDVGPEMRPVTGDVLVLDQRGDS